MKFMPILIFVFLTVASLGQEIPLMSSQDFDFELDYNFVTKPPPSKDRVNYDENVKYNSGYLPYVKVSITFKNLPYDAFRVRVVDGSMSTLKSKKLKNVETLNFDLGFADDIKDRVKPHLFYVYVESKSKKRLSLIKIFIEESGDFYLNEKLYGKI